MPASQETGHCEDVANSFIYPLSVLYSFRVCRLVRWRVQLFQKLCFTRDFCSKCFLDVNRGICALFGICSFIAWSGATVWSMTQEKICKPCACTKCKPCCSWQVLPPTISENPAFVFSYCINLGGISQERDFEKSESLLLCKGNRTRRDLNRLGVNKAAVRPYRL